MAPCGVLIVRVRTNARTQRWNFTLSRSSRRSATFNAGDANSALCSAERRFLTQAGVRRSAATIPDPPRSPR
jgi:hypothetical protein